MASGVPDLMASMARDFFQALYTRDGGVVPDYLVSMIEGRVSREMNKQLCRKFTNEEIGDALYQIGPLKAVRNIAPLGYSL